MAQFLRSMKLYLAFALLATCLSSTQADEHPAPSETVREIRVLGIGNSFTSNAFSFLHPMGTRSANFRIVLGQAIIGGCSMEKHMRLANLHETSPDDPEGRPYSLTSVGEDGVNVKTRVGLRELLASKDWDVVTIQQLSAQSPDIANYRPYARQLYDYIKRYAPRAEVVLHQTWAYRTDGDFDRVFPDKPSYGQAEMYRDLSVAYRTIAGELDVRMIPVGAAFQVAREARPYVADSASNRDRLRPPQLPKDKNSLCAGWSWDSSDPPRLKCDTHHAGIRGKYLAAAVWFEFLTGANVRAEGIRIETLTDEEAEFLSDIAHQVVAHRRRPSIEPGEPN